MLFSFYRDFLQHNSRVERFEDEFVNAVGHLLPWQRDLLFHDATGHGGVVDAVDILRFLVEVGVEVHRLALAVEAYAIA